jgi:RNA polymerase sigma factor (sigma-70 family)
MLMSRHCAADADTFAAVFFATVRNLCVDVIRHRQRRPTMSLIDVAVEPTSAGETDELAQLQRAIRDAIDDLPKPWADALRLRVDGNLAYDEIATVLKCTKPQVRTWIFRGRRQLERELAKLERLSDDHALRAPR